MLKNWLCASWIEQILNRATFWAHQNIIPLVKVPIPIWLLGTSQLLGKIQISRSNILSGPKCLARVACLWSKMLMFQRAGMEERGLPLPLAYQYLILMIWRACHLNLDMISSLDSKGQDFKLRGLQFHFTKWLKNGHPNFKDLPFWILNQVKISWPNLNHKVFIT